MKETEMDGGASRVQRSNFCMRAGQPGEGVSDDKTGGSIYYTHLL